MSRTPARPSALRGKVFRGSEQVRAGRLTKGQLRSTAWRRLFPDVYACASLPVDHARRARAAAHLALPGAMVSGRSAGVLWGCGPGRAGRRRRVHLAPGCRAGGLRGIQVTRRALPPDEVTWCRGVRVTAVGRTALDLARIQPVEEAVVALDQFLGAGLLTMGRLRTAAAAATGPGCRQIRRAVDLADGLAESPQETRLRLLLHQSPLPRPIAQYSVREGTRFVARVDFAWPDAKVAVEYEGMWHGRPQQVARDRRRLNQLTAAGWTVVFVTAADLHDPVQVIARIAAALAARSYA